MCKNSQVNSENKFAISKSIFLFMTLTAFATISPAANLEEYKRVAQETIDEAKSGNIDNVDHLIDKQSRLIQIGIEACEEYARKHPDTKHILDLVTTNSEMMKQLTLEQIEKQWHQGGELKKYGYTLKEDHFGDVGNLIDAVIHPATSYIALTNYKASGDKAYLEQVIAELSEVLVHLHHLE